ncbi:MAG: hypothetical protein IJH63_00720 [Methanobrevibacter sp.]|nr:hypothetical protein [Methanosphaera sp.]MBR0369227.1 hypothetical protein [Methanobrevibacter sp.]
MITYNDIKEYYTVICETGETVEITFSNGEKLSIKPDTKIRRKPESDNLIELTNTYKDSMLLNLKFARSIELKKEKNIKLGEIYKPSKNGMRRV